MTGMTTELILTWADRSHYIFQQQSRALLSCACYSKYEYQNRAPNPNKKLLLCSMIKLNGIPAKISILGIYVYEVKRHH